MTATPAPTPQAHPAPPDAPVPRVPLRRAMAVLWWERLAPIVWPAVLAPLAYVALALFGVWGVLGDVVQTVALAAALLTACAFAVQGALAGPFPTRAAALRRIEEDSGLTGRPLEPLFDAPVDGAVTPLWTEHQRRAHAAADKAQVARPRPVYAPLDPHCLRYAAPLVLLLGLAVANTNAPSRLADAFGLNAHDGATAPFRVRAWIDPPAYTGRAPIYLADGPNADAVNAPVGSQLVLVAVDAGRAPSARVRVDGRRSRVRLTPAEGGGFEARVPVTGDVVADLGGERLRITAIADIPPLVILMEDPQTGDDERLIVRHRAVDDYGVTGLELVLSREGFADRVTPMEIRPGVGDARGVEVALEMDGHPWAGETVTARVRATDAIGQTADSAQAEVRLPQRLFLDPLAKALVEQRGAILSAERAYAQAPSGEAPNGGVRKPASYTLNRAPEEIRSAHQALGLLQDGRALFAEDYAVHTAMSYVRRGLAHSADLDEAQSLAPILWDAAIRAEGGELADAERAMRLAQRALADALARGDPAEDIERLAQAYREAVDRYLEELARQAIASGEDPGDLSEAAQSLTPSELAALRALLDELIATGASDDARVALDRLADLLNNLQFSADGSGGEGEGFAMGQGGGGDGQGQADGSGEGGDASPEEQVNDALGRLSDAIARQRALLDDTQAADPFQPAAPGLATPAPSDAAPQSAPPADFADLLARQRELSDLVGDVLDQLLADSLNNDGPRTALGELATANESMRFAEEALGRGSARDAVDEQARALRRLREASNALAQAALAAERAAAEAAQEAAEAAGQAGAGGADPDSETASGPGSFDPLGRSGAAGQGVNEALDLPDADALSRSRAILQDLRNRLREADLPPEERQYLERLLERF